MRRLIWLLIFVPVALQASADEDQVPVNISAIEDPATASAEGRDGLVFDLGDDVSVRFTGTAEFELKRERDFEALQTNTAPIVITPGLEISVADWLVLFGALEFGYEAGDSALLVDELYAEASNEDLSPFSLKGGYYTIPFGHFDTRHDASPLPETAFEAKGDVAELIFGHGAITANAYAFRGRRNWVLTRFAGENEEEQNQDWRVGGGVAHTASVNGLTIDAYVDLTNGIFSSSELIYSVPDRLGGLGGSARVAVGNQYAAITLQYVAALEEINFYDEDEETTTAARPSAFSIEIAGTREFDYFTGFAAAGYSRTWDLMPLLPQEQVLLTAGVRKDQWEFLVEYGHQWDYPSPDDGSRAEGHFFGAKAAFEW
ncbi:hypothetical protein [Oricola cellulosilytica]|uniref:Porin n=1 Tax=Oricola cellulosilytica TaxID=1429082 RepID=A0A4R0PAC1_9HYPH|nr:hypothetical protein [Oricola cellulosilytica]TCD14190.1 hypothetical protein E0D97_08890 [Oricola cellulosilytica]